jgi:hypothetical protein
LIFDVYAALANVWQGKMVALSFGEPDWRSDHWGVTFISTADKHARAA